MRTQLLSCTALLSIALSGCGGANAGAPASATAIDTTPLRNEAPSTGRAESRASRTAGTPFASDGFVKLYSFARPPDGEHPVAGLAAVNGTLFGTTPNGGPNEQGTVYSITPSGVETVVYGFDLASGVYSYANLIDVNGTLYGTNEAGGNASGTVFRVSVGGALQVVYAFNCCTSDGQNPYAALTDVNGTLYGTTEAGGTNGLGTVFSLTPAGTEQVLYSFAGGTADGANPYSNLVALNGALYGTTANGGANGLGTVFRVSLSGAEHVLHSFAGGADGANPYAGMIAVNGSLYGTTANGGTSGDGTVFRIGTSGTERVIYTFTGGTASGAAPRAELIDVNNTLYGTTTAGGARNGGTAFKLSLNGVEHVLHGFTGGMDGGNPAGSLVELNGLLYGTTVGGGGNHSYGTVFSVLP